MADITYYGPGGKPKKLRDQGDGTWAEVVYVSDPGSGGGVTALVPKGVGQITGIAGAAVLLSSVSGGIPAGATTVVVVGEAAALRWKDDGVAPTATVGMPLPIGQYMTFNAA